MGVTEPAIYGAFIKFRRPFIAVIIGGGLGGLFAGFMKVKTYSMVWGLMGLPSYAQNQDFSNLIFMIASVVIAFIGAAIAAYILGIPSEEKSKDTVAAPGGDSKPLNKKVIFSSAAEGEAVQLENIKDQAFSTGALGKGIGIIPSSNEVVSPLEGEVTVVFPTKHAIGLKTDSGIEVLIHIGVDTVELEGKYFETVVKEGDRVVPGQLLSKVDFSGIIEAGYDPTIIVIVANTPDYLDVIPTASGAVTKDCEIFTVIV